jgi:hypothetical protein
MEQTDFAKRYCDVYNKIFSSYPKWKRNAIEEDLSKKYDSGLLKEFIRNVIETAEKEEISLTE